MIKEIDRDISMTASEKEAAQHAAHSSDESMANALGLITGLILATNLGAAETADSLHRAYLSFVVALREGERIRMRNEN